MCAAWGVVGTDSHEGPIEYENCDGLVAMLFSKFPNVKFHPFCIKEYKTLSKRLRPTEVPIAAGTLIAL